MRPHAPGVGSAYGARRFDGLQRRGSRLLRDELGVPHLGLDPWGSLIASPATDEHETAMPVLHDQAVRQLGLPAGCIRSNGFAWKVPGGSRYLNVPDVTVLAPGWQRVGDWHVDPPPLLLVEVASPSTGAVDRGRKLADYRLGERVCTCWSTCLVLVALARWALRPTTSTGTGGWPRRTQSSSWSAAGRSGLIWAIAELPLAPHPGCRPQTRLRRDGGLPHHASRFILPPPGALRDRRPARGGSACRG